MVVHDLYVAKVRAACLVQHPGDGARSNRISGRHGMQNGSVSNVWFPAVGGSASFIGMTR